ncbi:MAG: PAS domain S-box protein [Fibrobacterota bacterium]
MIYENLIIGKERYPEKLKRKKALVHGCLLMAAFIIALARTLMIFLMMSGRVDFWTGAVIIRVVLLFFFGVSFYSNYIGFFKTAVWINLIVSVLFVWLVSGPYYHLTGFPVQKIYIVVPILFAFTFLEFKRAFMYSAAASLLIILVPVNMNFDEQAARDVNFFILAFLGISSVLFFIQLKLRKEKALEAAENERVFRLITEKSSDIIMIVSKGGICRYVSPSVARMTGYSPQEITGRYLGELALGSELQGILKLGEKARLNPGEEFFLPKLTVKTHDGKGIRIFEAFFTGFSDEPSIGGVVVNMRDITERENDRLELKKAGERYRKIFDSAAEGFLIFDLKGNVVEANNSVCRMYGYSREEMLGLHGTDFVTPAYQHLFRKFVVDVGEGHEFRSESVDIRKDGTEFNISVSGVAFEYEGKPRLLAVITDITEKKKIEERLRMAEKMEAVGHLAGGVAHDFNNQLLGILGYADLIYNYEDLPEKITGYAGKIVSASERSSELIGQLLAFARKGKYKIEKVDLHSVLEEALGIAGRGIGRDIRIERFFSEVPLYTEGDSTQLINAFLNILINARDAMPEGGKIEIITNKISLEADLSIEGPFRSLKAGEYASVAVNDSGCGIPEKLKNKIFEPFFSTKGEKGTGMGLAAVYGTVESHKGVLSLESSEKTGTKFTIFLPLYTNIAKAVSNNNDSGSNESRVDFTSDKKHIMIVDDEEISCAVLQEMLNKSGCQTSAFTNAAEALSFFRKSDKRISAAVIDLVMPGMNGKKLVQELKLINPFVKCILSSGMFSDEIEKLPEDLSLSGFIRKPYRRSDIENVLKDILGK